MITYIYNHQFQPPAPLVHVTIERVDGTGRMNDIPAQIDYAADRTIIPASVVESLQLIPFKEIPLLGFGGALTLAPVFRIQLQVRGTGPLKINVAAHGQEPLALLGRDVLNQFRITLDGPEKKMTIHN